ncbi:myosin heavy chain kinase c-like protein [Trypanosoma theileri]|uniref:Myosin heavy chain kinase c-like protein n=1 Tax=Trypanosoma theileri TaxID=67003 RepID=A0A1X0P576_9TRYP|nr:myosin heavy chain kinase c-like protein [Trypanosoma theileri]ORC91803.1 myosin heavy chain kinase c-like protein [Trypanosoma theileri]
MSCTKETLQQQSQSSCIGEQNTQDNKLYCNKVNDEKKNLLSLPENKPTQCVASPLNRSNVSHKKSRKNNKDSKCVEVTETVPLIVKGKKSEMRSSHHSLDVKNDVSESLITTTNSDECVVNATVNDKQTCMQPQPQLSFPTETTTKEKISFSQVESRPLETAGCSTSSPRPMSVNLNEMSEKEEEEPNSPSENTGAKGDCTMDTSEKRNKDIVSTRIPPSLTTNQMICVVTNQPMKPNNQEMLCNSAQQVPSKRHSCSTRSSISSCSTCEYAREYSGSRSYSSYSTTESSFESNSHTIYSSLSRTTFERSSSDSRIIGGSDSSSSSTNGSNNYSDSCYSSYDTRSSSSSSSSSRSRSSNSRIKAKKEVPAIIPLKNGSVDALPLGAFIDLHYRFCLKAHLNIYSESAIVYEWDTTHGVWTTVKTSVVIFPTPFAHGDMRASYYVIDLNRLNCKMVAKRYRYSSVKETQYFDDVSMHTIANHWAKKFNSCMPPKPVYFLPAVVMELIDRKPSLFFAVEPQLDGNYTKYNNNSGYVPDEARWTPQAFSHFSYHASQRKLMIVDIQGVNDIYTDPQILTFDGKGYGRGNLGREGMRLFIRSHKCNGVCHMIGIPPLSYTRDIVNKLPMRNNAMIRTVPSQENDEGETTEILPPRSHGSKSSSFYRRPLAQRSLPDGITIYSSELPMPVRTNRRYIGFLRRMRIYLFRRFTFDRNSLQKNAVQRQQSS